MYQPTVRIESIVYYPDGMVRRFSCPEQVSKAKPVKSWEVMAGTWVEFKTGKK